MEIFKSFQLWMFYGLIVLSFAVNLFFFAKRLYFLFLKAGAKKRVLAALAFLSIFSLSMFFSSFVAVRGGYDNNHDVKYLSRSFFDIKQVPMIVGEKEASPLITDGISDIISDYSLDAVLMKNRLLIFLAAVILAAILLKLKLGYSSAIVGFGLFCFNFLAILNANTFTTTCSNIFFFLSSLFAIVCFQSEEKNKRGNLIWMLSAMFLTLTGRYELFIVSFMGFLTVIAIYLNKRESRFDIFKKHPLLSCGMAAYIFICLLWIFHISGFTSYNGPGMGEAFNLMENLKYQLIERNAAFFMRQSPLIVPILIVISFLMLFLRSLKDRRKSAENLTIGLFIAVWIIYFSIIFKPLDLYPLHFMRHRLYFFIPFVFLAAFAWDCAIFFLRRVKFVQILKSVAALALILTYAVLNIRAVESLQNERRTNDIELDFLSKAQREMGNDYVVVYPSFDGRFFLLKKYFPFYGNCSLIKKERHVKYISPESFIMRRKGSVIQRYSPFKSNYVSEDDEAVFETAFNHKFYTAWPGAETRSEIPLEIGFYRADSSKDKAWILNSKGHCAFKSGDFDGALIYFKEAFRIDSDCIVCSYNLSACYAVLGMEKESLTTIENSFKSRSSSGAPLLEKALVHMALAENKDAIKLFRVFEREEINKNGHQNEILLIMAAEYIKALGKPEKNGNY